MRDWLRVVGHFDMDAFYVSVELQRRPELRGRPVVVCGEGPRAVVTTASYEARRFGIFSATPGARARRQCPEAIFVRPDFELYRTRSHEVMAVLRSHFPTVETAGLDEAYVELTGLDRPRAAARRAKTEILRGTGLGCSIGIGPSKLVAKVASDAEKPDGFVVLSRSEAYERFADASPGLIPGIGPRTVERLAKGGVTTVGALARTPETDLSTWFGARHGPALGRLARFEDERPVESVRVAKSESRETTFDRDIAALPELERVLERLAAELCAALGEKGRSGRTVGIKVRTSDFSTHTRARTLASPTADRALVASVGVDLLRELAPALPVRLLGVRVAGLCQVAAEPAPGPSDGAQLGLGLR